jgi:endonuclease-3
MNKLFDYLDELYPNPRSELNYSNDFELLIAVVLSAHTTDKKVNMVTKVLFSRYDIKRLKEEDIKVLEDILKPIGMAHKKAIYIKNIAKDLYDNYNSIIPKTREELMKLSGVGRKTSNLVLSVIYNEPFIAVDTHINRVSKRLMIANEKDSNEVIEKKLHKIIPTDRLLKAHHQLVLFGRYKCKATKPECSDCKLKDICKYKKRNV